MTPSLLNNDEMVDAGRSSSKTACMLYVDPDATDRQRTVRALESTPDLAVEGVATAAACRDALGDETSQYACVVTEYHLDETDALSLYDSVQADGVVTVPFVLYPSAGTETLASDALTAGFSGYVPSGRDDSIDRLREQLRTVSGLETNSTEHQRHGRDLERYRTLVETVGDSMYVLDSAGRIELVNDAMADSLGESRETLVGENVSKYVSQDDAERIVAMLEGIRTTDGKTWGTVDVTVEFGDGTSCDAEANVAPLTDSDGALAGSVGVIRDVSARKTREYQIRQLHDGTRRLMAAKATEEIARVVTEIATDALDLDCNSVHLYKANVLTRSVRDAGTDRTADSPSSAEPTAESPETDGGGLVPAAMSDRAADLFGDISYIEPDGGVAWDAYEAGEAIVHGDIRHAPNVRNPETPVRSEAHIPLGDHGIFIVSSLEVNDFDPEALTLARILAANAEAALDRAERECKLADRSQELERQNERLEAFASTVSHDLRNPLTLASGHLENLAGVVDADGQAHLEEIDWALERMDELIENVLTLARSGQRLTEMEPVDLGTVVRQAHRTVDPDLEVCDDGLLPTVDADEAHLRVLFENVLRNAHEHAGEDVTVTVTRTAGGFAIDDDGPGVPPDERDAVLESGYSTAAEGTGFGLAIVSEVVEAHGWSMTLEESAAGGLRVAVSVESSQETVRT